MTSTTAPAPALTADDARWMAHALQLAAQGLFTTGVNPRVGCVLVHAEQLIGAGWHEQAGGPHAEIWALRDAAGRGQLPAGRLPPGSTAYVTLEPCSHHGKTPPCAEALIAAGVSRVVAALADPNPLVAGRGFALLRAAGIVVQTPLMADAARALNIGFIQRMQNGKPWLRLKMAGSLDGRSALANGKSQWLTGPAARQDGHRYRARAQAIITGIGTVLADDPRLTVRGVVAAQAQTIAPPIFNNVPFVLSLSKDSGQAHLTSCNDAVVPLAIPWRVIVDSRLRTPLNAQILGPDCLIATASTDAAKMATLAATGTRIVTLVDDATGQVDLAALLTQLATLGVNEAHLEAGATLSAAFVAAGLVDEYLFYLAPCLLGGDARGFFEALGLTDLAQKTALTFTDVRRVGDDLRLLARPAAAHDAIHSAAN